MDIVEDITDLIEGILEGLSSLMGNDPINKPSAQPPKEYLPGYKGASAPKRPGKLSDQLPELDKPPETAREGITDPSPVKGDDGNDGEEGGEDGDGEGEGGADGGDE